MIQRLRGTYEGKERVEWVSREIQANSVVSTANLFLFEICGR